MYQVRIYLYQVRFFEKAKKEYQVLFLNLVPFLGMQFFSQYAVGFLFFHKVKEIFPHYPEQIKRPQKGCEPGFPGYARFPISGSNVLRT